MTRSLSALLVLIDLDDTITDREAAFDSWAVGFLARNLRSAEEIVHLRELDRRGVRPREEFLSLTFERLGLELDVDAELIAYRNVTATPPVQRGVAARLRTVKASGGRLAVVSNGVPDVQHRKLDSTGVRWLFDAVVISGEEAFAKPDPRIFEVAVERAAGIETSTIWMVGDNATVDIQGAMALGLRTAWVNRRGVDWPGGPHPDLDLPTTGVCLDRIIQATDLNRATPLGSANATRPEDLSDE